MCSLDYSNRKTRIDLEFVFKEQRQPRKRLVAEVAGNRLEFSVEDD